MGAQVELFVSSGKPEVTVPDETGQSESDAKAALEAAGLTAATTTQTSSSVSAGNVISQDPPGGSTVPTGSTVTLVIASAPATVTVPGVTGQNGERGVQHPQRRGPDRQPDNEDGDQEKAGRGGPLSKPRRQRDGQEGERCDHRRRSVPGTDADDEHPHDEHSDADDAFHSDHAMTSLRVAVLGGGRSSEHEVSLASAASVREGLRAGGHHPVEVEVQRDGVWLVDGRALQLRPGEGIEGVDAVFPVLHGPFGEDGTVQGLLECLDIPYVGAGVLASALCMDKVLFKDLMVHAGVPQVAYRAAPVERYRADPRALQRDLEALGWPVFVKPARLGSSVGIARVAEPSELPAALEAAFAHDPLAIVEAAASGIEVECSVIGNSDPVASEPGEIVLAAGPGGWYDYEAKYTPGGMELIVPARVTPAVRERVRALAVDTFRRTGCCGLARVDFFVEGETVLVNELNTMPGFTATSVFASLFAASGVPYPELLDRLLVLALERHAAQRRQAF